MIPLPADNLFAFDLLAASTDARILSVTSGVTGDCRDAEAEGPAVAVGLCCGLEIDGSVASSEEVVRSNCEEERRQGTIFDRTKKAFSILRN